jgi:hypothetical protein
MTNFMTITGTDTNAVRFVIASFRDYWEGTGDFSGPIIQNKVTPSTIMLATTSPNFSAANLTDPLILTDVAYTALMNNGTPTQVAMDWARSKVVQGMRGHVINFEAERAARAAVTTAWTMNGS